MTDKATQRCTATAILRTDENDPGKNRTCELPLGHDGRHAADYCGVRQEWPASPDQGLRERATKAAIAALQVPQGESEAVQFPKVRDALLNFAALAREEAIEECAKLAESPTESGLRVPNAGRIAERIRSLRAPAAKEEQPNTNTLKGPSKDLGVVGAEPREAPLDADQRLAKSAVGLGQDAARGGWSAPGTTELSAAHAVGVREGMRRAAEMADKRAKEHEEQRGRCIVGSWLYGKWDFSAMEFRFFAQSLKNSAASPSEQGQEKPEDPATDEALAQRSQASASEGEARTTSADSEAVGSERLTTVAVDAFVPLQCDTKQRSGVLTPSAPQATGTSTGEPRAACGTDPGTGWPSPTLDSRSIAANVPPMRRLSKEQIRKMPCPFPPEPAPTQPTPDVFERLGKELAASYIWTREDTTAFLRARFGPLVEALEKVKTDCCDCGACADNSMHVAGCPAGIAGSALARLRQTGMSP